MGTWVSVLLGPSGDEVECTSELSTLKKMRGSIYLPDPGPQWSRIDPWLLTFSLLFRFTYE